MSGSTLTTSNVEMMTVTVNPDTDEVSCKVVPVSTLSPIIEKVMAQVEVERSKESNPSNFDS